MNCELCGRDVAEINPANKCCYICIRLSNLGSCLEKSRKLINQAKQYIKTANELKALIACDWYKNRRKT